MRFEYWQKSWNTGISSGVKRPVRKFMLTLVFHLDVKGVFETYAYRSHQ